MTWDGDISHMGELADRVADLAAVPSRASARLAPMIAALIEEQFARGHDPYGEEYAPLSPVTIELRSQTTEPPLTDYGHMRRSVAVKPMRGSGVSITIDHPAAPHQTGWSGVLMGDGPARPILPYAEMPEEWEEAIDEAIKRSVRR